MKKEILLKTGAITVPIIFSLVFFVTQAQAEPYGWSPNVDNSWGGTPSCTDSKPDKAPILLQPNHPLLPKGGPGEVRLFWHKVPGATGYNVYYGLSPSNYIFSAADIGDTDNFTVGHLGSRRYYFAVQAKKGCAAGDLSNEWWGAAGGGSGTGGFRVNNFVKTNDNTVIEPIIVPEPTTVEAVQGVEQYQPPVEQPNYEVTNPAPFVPQPTPKPLNFWQKLWKFFFK